MLDSEHVSTTITNALPTATTANGTERFGPPINLELLRPRCEIIAECKTTVVTVAVVGFYRWQVSDDGVVWYDLEGAERRDRTLLGPLPFPWWAAGGFKLARVAAMLTGATTWREDTTAVRYHTRRYGS